MVDLYHIVSPLTHSPIWRGHLEIEVLFGGSAWSAGTYYCRIFTDHDTESTTISFGWWGLSWLGKLEKKDHTISVRGDYLHIPILFDLFWRYYIPRSFAYFQEELLEDNDEVTITIRPEEVVKCSGRYFEELKRATADSWHKMVEWWLDTDAVERFGRNYQVCSTHVDEVYRYCEVLWPSIRLVLRKRGRLGKVYSTRASALGYLRMSDMIPPQLLNIVSQYEEGLSFPDPYCNEDCSVIQSQLQKIATSDNVMMTFPHPSQPGLQLVIESWERLKLGDIDRPPKEQTVDVAMQNTEGTIVHKVRLTCSWPKSQEISLRERRWSVDEKVKRLYTFISMLWCAGLYPMHSKATRVQEDSQPAEQQSVTNAHSPPNSSMLTTKIRRPYRP